MFTHSMIQSLDCLSLLILVDSYRLFSVVLPPLAQHVSWNVLAEAMDDVWVESIANFTLGRDVRDKGLCETEPGLVWKARIVLCDFDPKTDSTEFCSAWSTQLQSLCMSAFQKFHISQECTAFSQA